MTSSRDNFVGPTLPLCDGDWHSVEVSVTRDKLHFRCDEFIKSISVFSPDPEVQLVSIGATAKGNNRRQSQSQNDMILKAALWGLPFYISK